MNVIKTEEGKLTVPQTAKSATIFWRKYFTFPGGSCRHFTDDKKGSEVNN